MTGSASQGMQLRSSIGRTAAETLALKILLTLVAMVATVVISRVLGPEGRGIYYVPVVAAATVITFAKLGLEQANVFLYGTRSIPAERLASQSGFVALAAGVVGIVTMLLASLAVPSVFGDVPLVLTVLASLTIPFSLHTQFIAGLQNLTGQVTLQFKAALVSGLAQLAALIALALLQLIDVSTALAVNLFGAAVAWVATLTRSSVRSWTVSWDAGLFKETMSHSLALHAGTILLFLHLRADSFMVKAISGTEALGIYSLGVVIAETVLLATDSVAIALLPRQVAADLADAAQVALRAARFNGYFAILFSLVLVGTGWFVIPLAFGQAFHETYPVLAALVPGILFMSMQRVCGVPVVRAGTPLRITAIFAVSLALNVALNLVWIPRFGPVGASLASSVSYAVAAALFLAWTAQLAGSLTYLLPVRSDADVLGRAVVLLRGGSAIRTGAEAALRERPR